MTDSFYVGVINDLLEQLNNFEISYNELFKRLLELDSELLVNDKNYVESRNLIRNTLRSIAYDKEFLNRIINKKELHLMFFEKKKNDFDQLMFIYDFNYKTTEKKIEKLETKKQMLPKSKKVRKKKK